VRNHPTFGSRSGLILYHLSLALLTDADFFLNGLSTSFFPGVPSSVQVHNGFGDAHAKWVAPLDDESSRYSRTKRTANAVLAAVTTGINTYGTRSVAAVGHSLGAALSLLDAISLSLRIPNLTVTYYGYGLPRVSVVTEISSTEMLDDLILFCVGRKPRFRQLRGQQTRWQVHSHHKLQRSRPNSPRSILGLPPSFWRSPHR
jgi:hypothetical protein